MLRWRLGADNQAIQTACGEKTDFEIRATGAAGCLIYGPYLDFPAGNLSGRIHFAEGASGRVRCDIATDGGKQILASQEFDLSEMAHSLQISAICQDPPKRAELRLFIDATTCVSVTWIEFDLDAGASEAPTLERPVGEESKKTFANKVASGFVERYLSGGSILEIGFRGYRDEIVVPIVPQAIGIDIGYPGYDGKKLPFADSSVDSIYSSHCLEHIPDYETAFNDWYRLLKVGGYLIIAVPHQYLFEKQLLLPSKSNTDHRRYYTPESLLMELRSSWPENSYRIRQLIENDAGFDYSRFPEEPSPGCYEIELVAQKIEVPSWRLDDGSVRPYGAAEFHACGAQRDKWAIKVDFAEDNPWKVWGPYARLVPARYVAVFWLSGEFEEESLESDIVLDVAIARQRATSVTLFGKAGAESLRTGKTSLPFEVVGAPSHVEFRIFAEGRPIRSDLIFKGVEVQFERATQ